MFLEPDSNFLSSLAFFICQRLFLLAFLHRIIRRFPGVRSANHRKRIPDTFLAYLKECLPSPKTHKVYFDHGTVTLDAFYPSFQKQADAIMSSKGFTSKNWITKVFQGDDHSEKSWAKRLNIPLEFLLGKN